MSSPCSVPEWLRGLLPLETEAQQKACQRHDLAYEAGGDRKERLYADLKFAEELLMSDMDPDTAEQYLWGVRMYAGGHWCGGDSPGALPPPEPLRIESP